MVRQAWRTICQAALWTAVAAAPGAGVAADAPSARGAAQPKVSDPTVLEAAQPVKKLDAVQVRAAASSLGGGMMAVQDAPKAVSTMTREAIRKAGAGSNFTQLIGSIPGVNASTDDVTGMANGAYSIRGFDASDIGMTLNGAPITDTGNYAVYATEYGDSENIGDITVLQGTPDLDMPDSGASGGHIAWATIDPAHRPGVDVTQTFGSHAYKRSFMRFNTGDTGPVRSWVSLSYNQADKWRGAGRLRVFKVDGKSVWTIDDHNSLSASLQYNHQHNASYYSVAKSELMQYGYHYDYHTRWMAENTPGFSREDARYDRNYWRLATNPFNSALFSLDGEFKLAHRLALSAIPYVWWGSGGSGSGGIVTESTSQGQAYGYSMQNLAGTGPPVEGRPAVVYNFSKALTYRPGVIFRFNQDLGIHDGLEYGLWYERSRKSQNNNSSLVDPLHGHPLDYWADSNYLRYADGQVQRSYDEYTNTEIEKGFLINNWTPVDWLTLNTGVSYLHVVRKGFVYEYPGATMGAVGKRQAYADTDQSWNKVLPGAGVKFQLDDKNQIYLNSGKTFRAPPNTVGFLNTLVGNASNRPETAWNADLGYRYYGDRFAASVDVYRSNYNNKQQSAYDQRTGYTYYTSLNRMHMEGFNGELSYRFLSAWSVYASYTYTRAKIVGALDGGDNGVYPTNGKSMPNTPRHIGNLGLNYDDRRLWGSLYARTSSSIFGDYMNTESAGGYTTLNFAAGYRFHDVNKLYRQPYIKFNLYNLTDRRALPNVASIRLLAQPRGSLHADAPYYDRLEPRAFSVTFGMSLF